MHNRFRTKVMLVLSASLLLWQVRGADSAATGIVAGEVIHFSTTLLDTGKKVSSGRYEFVVSDSLVRQRGHFQFANGTRGDEESVLTVNASRYVPKSFSYLVTNAQGKLIREEKMSFSPNGREVHVIRRYRDPTGQEDGGVTDEVDKRVQVPEGTYARPMFDTILRTMDITPGSRQKLYCITRLGEVYGMFLQEDGRESVVTPAGTFDTVRVRLVPDIPLLPTLMPSLTIRLWYSMEKPRVAVKFEGYPQPPPPRIQDEVRTVVTRVERPKQAAE